MEQRLPELEEQAQTLKAQCDALDVPEEDKVGGVGLMLVWRLVQACQRVHTSPYICTDPSRALAASCMSMHALPRVQILHPCHKLIQLPKKRISLLHLDRTSAPALSDVVQYLSKLRHTQVKAYLSLLQRYSNLSAELRLVISQPSNSLPFLQPGRLIRVLPRPQAAGEALPDFSAFSDEQVASASLSFGNTSVGCVGTRHYLLSHGTHVYYDLAPYIWTCCYSQLPRTQKD